MLNLSRNASFIRVCQTGTVPRDALSTSLSKRIATCSLIPLPAGRPRYFNAAAKPVRNSSALNGQSSSLTPSHTYVDSLGSARTASSTCLRVISFVLDAVALRFAHCDQLAGGLAPPRVRPCWAHKKKAINLSTDGFLDLAEWTGLEPATPGVTGQH